MSDAPPIIYPWEGTGWPIEIFKEPNIEMIRKHYMCTHNECGNVLRDPMQLECGDRVCEGCYNILFQIPAVQRICHACEGEIHNANTNTPMAAQIQRIDPFLEIQPKRITQTMAQTEELGHQGMELDATTSSQAVQSGKSELEKSAWIIPEKCNRDNAAAMEINKLDVKCPYRCDTERVGTRPLCIRTLKKHMRDCLLRLVACEDCTDRVRLCDLESHLSLGCPFRMVDCPNGCGKRGIQGKDLADHDLVCDRRTSAAVSCTQDVLQALCVVQDKQREYENRQRQFEDWKRESANENRSLKEQVKNVKEERKRDKLINDAYIDFLICEKQNLCPGIGTPPVSLVKITEVSIDQIINLTARPEYQKEDGKGTLIFGLAGADLQTCEGSKWKFSIPCCIKSSGLTFRVGVKPYGCGQAENSHMFVCFVRMNGGDELDTQPEFNLQLTLALRNLENKEHIVKTFSPMVFTKPTDDQHVAYGCLKFVPRQKLETGNGYIKEDMLILQISVREMQGGIAQAP